MKYVVVFILLLSMPCNSKSMSITQGPYYGINHTDYSYSTMGLSYNKQVSGKWIISPEVLYFSEISNNNQMVTVSSILKYKWLNNNNFNSYGLFGGGVALLDYGSESEGNVLFNLECGVGAEYVIYSIGIFGEYRLKHQSNAFLGKNLGQDTHGFNIGINYYF